MKRRRGFGIRNNGTRTPAVGVIGAISHVPLKIRCQLQVLRGTAVIEHRGVESACG